MSQRVDTCERLRHSLGVKEKKGENGIDVTTHDAVRVVQTPISSEYELLERRRTALRNSE